MADPIQPVQVLFVCLGNICRSPIAEGVFRQRVQQVGLSARINADSAGTADYHIGGPPDKRSQSICAAHGISIADLRGRQVHPGDFQRFDYILAMDRNNLLNLQRIQAAGSRARLALLMDYASGPQQGWDVPDPYYGDMTDFQQVLEMVQQGVNGLLRKIMMGP